MSDSLHTLDYTVIVLYFAAIVACGIYFGPIHKVYGRLLLRRSTLRLVADCSIVYCYPRRILQLYQLL